MLCILRREVYYEIYNVIRFCRHIDAFLDTCVFYLYFPLDWVLPYLDIYHNNATQVSSATAHDVQKDRETFFPWPCPCMLLCCVQGGIFPFSLTLPKVLVNNKGKYSPGISPVINSGIFRLKAARVITFTLNFIEG